MAFLNFGKKIKHRRFDYIPRYYDPDKEELESRLRRYKRTEGSDAELSKARIRGGFRRKYSNANEYARQSRRRSNMVLLATIILLLLLSYIFISEYLPKIIATFE
jgi:hypothetical protein